MAQLSFRFRSNRLNARPLALAQQWKSKLDVEKSDAKDGPGPIRIIPISTGLNLASTCRDLIGRMKDI